MGNVNILAGITANIENVINGLTENQAFEVVKLIDEHFGCFNFREAVFNYFRDLMKQYGDDDDDYDVG